MKRKLKRRGRLMKGRTLAGVKAMSSRPGHLPLGRK